MAKKLRAKRLDKVYAHIVRLLSSNGFFYAIVALMVLQGLWYAFSFQPTINDEARHLGNIFIYANHWSPFLGNQKTSWDHLGEITRDGSFMFYYVMSMPYRIVRLFTDNRADQIISLRIICVAFFAAGIVIYRKALLEIAGMSRALMHMAFLLFILTPAVAILPGAVNYDNFVFFLFAVLLLLAVRALKSKKVDVVSLAGVAITGLFMTVSKWASFPLLLPVVIFLCFDLYQKHGKNILSRTLDGVKHIKRWQQVVLAIGLVITLGLFIERPVVNVIKYGNPEPVCQKVIGNARCLSFRDYVIYKNLADSKPASFTPHDPIQYMLSIWEPRMADTSVNTLEQGHVSELPIVKVLYSFAGIGGIVLILLYAREFLEYKYFRFLLFIAAVYILFLAATEYQAYVQFAIPAAIRARYLVPVLPIFIYFAGLAFYRMFGKHKWFVLASACCVLLLLTQGGGITTYSLTTPGRIYWHNNGVVKINHDLQQVLRPLVVEHVSLL